MALTKCRECGASVADTAASCPNCGVEVPDAGMYRFNAACGIALLVALVIAFLTNPTEDSLQEHWLASEQAADVQSGKLKQWTTEYDYSHTSFGVLSIGRVNLTFKLGGPELETVAAIGVFGHWWFLGGPDD